jgi:hypothetical protein
VAVFKLLIDTCVWLDLAKDPQQRALLAVLDELARLNEISLILPRTIVDEFARNKARVVEESCRSLSNVMKRVKEVVGKFGDEKRKQLALDELNDVDHKIPLLGESAIESILQIDRLFKASPVLNITDDVKIRAAQRGIDVKAPFHRQRNGIGDAILIEMYADSIAEKESGRVRFAFVTHNTKDFSHPSGDARLPHPDIAPLFSRIRSRYFTSLAEALRRIKPALVSDLMIEHEWSQEPRRFTEILDAVEELCNKIWYNRHRRHSSLGYRTPVEYERDVLNVG